MFASHAALAMAAAQEHDRVQTITEDLKLQPIAVKDPRPPGRARRGVAARLVRRVLTSGRRSQADGRGPGRSRYGRGSCDGPGLLPPESALLLYTEGLIERWDRHLNDGLAELKATSDTLAAAPVEELCDGLLARLASHPTDDVCLLAVHLPSSRSSSGVGDG